jgi:hypothetical protein
MMKQLIKISEVARVENVERFYQEDDEICIEM